MSRPDLIHIKLNTQAGLLGQRQITKAGKQLILCEIFD
jgi:hypothetical protein